MRKELKEIVTATAPAYWASYLINGDASGISDEDRALADRFVEYLGASPCSVGEEYFSWTCDAPGVTLGGDMAEYTALVFS